MLSEAMGGLRWPVTMCEAGEEGGPRKQPGSIRSDFEGLMKK